MWWISCVRCKKFQHDFVARTCALIAPVRPFLRRSSCSNETVQNAPKHEFGIQWGGLGAFIAKNSDALCCTKFALKEPIKPFCTEVRSVSKRSETAQNMSSGSNRVERLSLFKKNSDVTSLLELG
jgi:hypothetical protein